MASKDPFDDGGGGPRNRREISPHAFDTGAGRSQSEQRIINEGATSKADRIAGARAMNNIIKREKARNREMGRFDTGVGSRLPGVGDDGPAIAEGPIIGNVNRRAGANLPFTAALINGLF